MKMNKNTLRQILVSGIIDYNRLFIEAYERSSRSIPGKGCELCNSDEKSVIMKMSSISSIYEEKQTGYIHGDDRIIIVTMDNKYRFTFTYETGTAIRLLWKRSMKYAAPFEYKIDKQNLNSFGGK